MQQQTVRLWRLFGGDRGGRSPNGFFIDRRTEIFRNAAVDALVMRSEVGEKKIAADTLDDCRNIAFETEDVANW